MHSSMYVFGGWLRRFTLTADTWRYSFVDQAWYPVRTLGTLLPATAAASAVAFPALDKIVLFGGVYQYRNGTAIYSNRLFTFAVRTDTITELFAPVSPSPREMHAATAWGDLMCVGNVYIYMSLYICI